LPANAFFLASFGGGKFQVLARRASNRAGENSRQLSDHETLPLLAPPLGPAALLEW
jgi:hypothetical protein